MKPAREISVIVCRWGRPPAIELMEATAEAFEATIGGSLEGVCLRSESAQLWAYVHEEGRFMRAPNRIFQSAGPVFGDMIIFRGGRGAEQSVTQSDLEWVLGHSAQVGPRVLMAQGRSEVQDVLEWVPALASAGIKPDLYHSALSIIRDLAPVAARLEESGKVAILDWLTRVVVALTAPETRASRRRMAGLGPSIGVCPHGTIVTEDRGCARCATESGKRQDVPWPASQVDVNAELDARFSEGPTPPAEVAAILDRQGRVKTWRDARALVEAQTRDPSIDLRDALRQLLAAGDGLAVADEVCPHGVEFTRDEGCVQCAAEAVSQPSKIQDEWADFVDAWRRSDLYPGKATAQQLAEIVGERDLPGSVLGRVPPQQRPWHLARALTALRGMVFDGLRICMDFDKSARRNMFHLEPEMRSQAKRGPTE